MSTKQVRVSPLAADRIEAIRRHLILQDNGRDKTSADVVDHVLERVWNRQYQKILERLQEERDAAGR